MGARNVLLKRADVEVVDLTSYPRAATHAKIVVIRAMPSISAM